MAQKNYTGELVNSLKIAVNEKDVEMHIGLFLEDIIRLVLIHHIRQMELLNVKIFIL